MSDRKAGSKAVSQKQLFQTIILKTSRAFLFNRASPEFKRLCGREEVLLTPFFDDFFWQTLVTLDTLFRSANQFYRAECITVSGFLI